jgi:hypothetical protein
MSLLKGGLVLLDPSTGAVESIIAFQYNPETLTRSFTIKGVGGEGDRSEALRLKGPPGETIKVEVELDATDLLASGDPVTLDAGLHPIIAQLELLVYPKSSALQANNSEASSGSLEIIAVETPLTVFVYGPKKIVPVRIAELSVTEESFDTSLNPIRAKVSLSMRVLTVDDISIDDKGGGLFMTYLQAKEQLAAKATAGSFDDLGITGIP